MEQYQNDMAAKFSKLLDEREAHLRAQLRELDPMAQGEIALGAHEVIDFKDVAEEETQTMLDQAQATHAMQELEQLQAARRRLSEHSYGICEDCGQPIDLRRLESLPTTLTCIVCQTAREKQSSHADFR